MFECSIWIQLLRARFILRLSSGSWPSNNPNVTDNDSKRCLILSLVISTLDKPVVLAVARSTNGKAYFTYCRPYLAGTTYLLLN